VNELHIQERLLDLKKRAATTDALPWNHPDKYANRILERQEAMVLLTDLFAFLQGVILESNEVLTLAFEVAAAATRDSTGHSWKRDFPDNATATQFYQTLRKFVRHMRMKVARAKSQPLPNAR
jgi:hypothetical protein